MIPAPDAALVAAGTAPRRGWLVSTLRRGLPVLLFCLPLGLAFWPHPYPGPCDVVIDMQVGSGPGARTGTIELWVNDTARDPLRLPAVPGVRSAYRFQLGGDTVVHFLRLDPSDYAGV